LRQMHC